MYHEWGGLEIPVGKAHILLVKGLILMLLMLDINQNMHHMTIRLQAI